MVDQYSPYQVAEHNTKNDCWVAIHGKVYNVTKYLLEHPGGEDILLEVSGRDATREFEDVGHSSEARGFLSDLLIGTVRDATAEEKAEQARIAATTGNLGIRTEKADTSTWQTVAKYVVPLLIIGLGLLIRNYSGLSASSTT